MGALPFQLTPQLAHALAQHAADFLHHNGINEPVTWEPPIDCLDGLSFPDREPSDINSAEVRRLITTERRLPSLVAKRFSNDPRTPSTGFRFRSVNQPRGA